MSQKLDQGYFISALKSSQQRQKSKSSVSVKEILSPGESSNLGPIWAYFENGLVWRILLLY